MDRLSAPENQALVPDFRARSVNIRALRSRRGYEYTKISFLKHYQYHLQKSNTKTFFHCYLQNVNMLRNPVGCPMCVGLSQLMCSIISGWFVERDL